MLTIQERWRFESISDQLANLFPTRTTLTDQVSYRSPYCTFQDQFMGSTGTAHTRGPFRRPRYPKYTKVTRRTLVVLLSHHQYNAYIGPIPGPDSAQASRSERLILPGKCGACVQQDKRAINDRSLIDIGRGTTVNTTIRPYPVSIHSHTWLLFIIALTANHSGVHLYLAGDRKSPDFYRTKQAKHRLRAYLHRTRWINRW